MNYKRKIYWVLILSFLGLVTGIVLTTSNGLGLCPIDDKFCFEPYDELFGQVLGLFASCLILISLILFFLKEQVFKIWSRFAMIFLPISIVLVFITPAVQGALIGLDREIITIGLAVTFFIASLLIIIVNSSKSKNKK